MKRNSFRKEIDYAFALTLLGFLLASPFLIFRKIKNRSPYHKSLMERLTEARQKNELKLLEKQQLLQELRERKNMDINVRSKIKSLEGETFYTVTGKPFTYKFASENTIKPSRTNYNIPLSHFERAYDRHPSELKELRDLRGCSYIFGVITDTRFR